MQTLPKPGDYAHLYDDSTQETLVSLYGKRNEKGDPIETVNDIINRVALSVALAELKYVLEPSEIVELSLEDAIKLGPVQDWYEKFRDYIGNQVFWANTPCNINADPEISLKVLKYWAHGIEEGFNEADLWLESEKLRQDFLSGATQDNLNLWHMGKLAQELRGKGCLAACGVAYVEDTLESIQNAATLEAMAAKAAMGMGINTSRLRPWSSVLSNGAAASGPDRFYGKTIAQAVEAVAQGGRRGGALIELRNSDHPDILFFIDKKRLIPPPDFGEIYQAVLSNPKYKNVSKSALLKAALQQFGKRYHEYLERQNYLKNTNITVLAMPGFMEAVQRGTWYQMQFNGKNWTGPVFDPRRPVIDEKTGRQKINKHTKELLYYHYAVDKERYPEAGVWKSNAGPRPGDPGHIYAPDLFDRICENMCDSGEPGIAFYSTVNMANGNPHIYDLDTCNPCGEQFLPAGPGKDGRVYMGNCNLSTMHAAHTWFCTRDGRMLSNEFAKAVAVQQRFMDNVTDVSWYPIPEQNMTARMERRNGGGFAGIAELLSRQGVEFGTSTALERIEEFYREYTRTSFNASHELALARGPYPLWNGSVFETKKQYIRNSCLINNPPTGTMAQALQTSWGVDPHNGIVFTRTVRSRDLDFVAPGFEDAMREAKAWPETEEGVAALCQKIRDNHKSCRGLAEVPELVQKAFPIRVEVEPNDYIRHLAAIHKGVQDYPETFNSVSNTCSIPLNYPVEKVREAVMLAWELGVKDVTFYPDSARLSQPVEKIAAANYTETDDLLALLGLKEPRDLSVEITEGTSYKVRVGTPDGTSTLHVSLNHEQNRPGELVEIYARMGKPGAIESGLFEAIGRLASAFLQFAARYGEEARRAAEETIIKQLINIQSGWVAWHTFPGGSKSQPITSPCDGLAKAIAHYREIHAKPFGLEWIYVTTPTITTNGEIKVAPMPIRCTKCGGETERIEGCNNCTKCGYSKCG